MEFPRDVRKALSQSYDLIVVGGGIYGMTLTLEAARHGLRPLLVERDDFGGATSLNSLRILHGGLRYLQNLNLLRFFESVKERDWFMKCFAPLCKELPCIMPLYGKGLKRSSVFRVALGINNTLSRSSPLLLSRLLNVDETIRRFPSVDRNGLQGGALWHDGQILSPQRLHAELLRWAVQCGATVLNYVEAIELKKEGSRVGGLVTNVGDFSAPVIINAAGPWSREVATRLDCDRPELMTPSLTFNVLLDVPPPSDAAVAVESSRVYFVTPHRAGLTFVGTVHRAWKGKREPTEQMIEEFIDDLNLAIPGWELLRSNVVRITSGVLPAIRGGEAEMAHKSTFVNHEIDGLFSICGIKYTTAHGFAKTVLNRVFGKKVCDNSLPNFERRASYVDPSTIVALDDESLYSFAAEESVTCVEDLIERRIDWILDDNERADFEARLRSVLDSKTLLKS